MEVNEFFSWELLSTAAGCAAVVWVFTSFLKQLFGRWWNDLAHGIATYVTALGVLIAVNVLAEASWPAYLLAVFNAAVVYGAVNQLSKSDLPRLTAKLKKD